MLMSAALSLLSLASSLKPPPSPPWPRGWPTCWYLHESFLVSGEAQSVTPSPRRPYLQRVRRVVRHRHAPQVSLGASLSDVVINLIFQVLIHRRQNTPRHHQRFFGPSTPTLHQPLKLSTRGVSLFGSNTWMIGGHPHSPALSLLRNFWQ